MERKNLPLVLTLDAGGTNFVFSAIKNYKIAGNEISQRADTNNLDNCLSSILKGFRELIALSNEKPEAISFAFPGPADYEQGIIGDLFNIPCFRGGIPLKSIIKTEFNLPVFINNDGDLFTLGEANKGFLPGANEKLNRSNSKKVFRNLFGVTLGTGFGGGCVIDNKLLLGDNSSASEVWLFSNKVYPEYNAESSIGINAIKREYSKAANINFENSPEPSEIFRIAKGELEGDKTSAVIAFQKMGIALGNVLANVSTIVDGLIVIGGGLSGAYDLFIDSLITEMKSKYKQFNGTEIPRLAFKIYDLENDDHLNKFLCDDIVKLNHNNNEIYYDRHKRIGIGKSKLGTSQAVSLGAYNFALQKLGYK